MLMINHIKKLALPTIFLLYIGFTFAASNDQIADAIQNPEYLLEHWISLPTSPKSNTQKPLKLTIREAVLLALRYNPNIQNAELDRIIQRYQLRLAHNEFELQFALAGSASIEKSRFSGIGNATTHSFIGTPEIGLKTKSGGQISLSMDNNVAPIGNYNPLLNLSYTQPLLRGFGKSVNEAALLNAEDTDWLNKLNLKQSVIDQITQVISSYRNLIARGNNSQNQQQQLAEAKVTHENNKKRIAAGQLEPTGNIQQEYQIESLSLSAEQAENDFKTSAQDLLQTIGLDPDLKLSVPDDINLDKIEIPDLQKSISLALNKNTAYIALEIAARADKRAYDVAKNQQLWQLDLKANSQAGTISSVDSVNKGFRGIYNGQNVSSSAGIFLTIPVNDLNRRNQIITAKVRLEKDRLNLITAKRALITLIKNTINNIESQAKRYKLAKRQVDLANQSYELEKKRQQAGITSARDVNLSQNQLLTAKAGLISAKIAYLNELSALERVLGTSLDSWHIHLRTSA